MNFDDTPQEAAFRAEARAWIDANAPKELEAELSRPTVGRIKLKGKDIVAERHHGRAAHALADQEHAFEFSVETFFLLPDHALDG